MKIKYFISLLIIIAGCSKLDLSEKEETHNEPPKPEINHSYITVEQALLNTVDSVATVEGFIVGYISGNSMQKGCIFNIPENGANTNLLLADKTNETSPEHSIAVKLEKTGKYATREELNLYTHPDYFQKKVRLTGYLSKYFSKNGITRVYFYEFVGNEFEGNDENFKDTLDIQVN